MSRRTSVPIVVALLFGVGTAAVAQDRRPDYGPSVNIAAAKKVAAATLAECDKNNWNVAVAVTDTHGYLVYFERMENTQYASIDIAIGNWPINRLLQQIGRHSVQGCRHQHQRHGNDQPLFIGRERAT